MNRFLLSVIILSTTLSSFQAFAEKGKSVIVDADKNGRVSVKEARVMAGKQFEVYDANKDGAVTEKEFTSLMDKIMIVKKQTAKQKATEDKLIKEGFSRIDTDKNGKISREEFLADAELRHKTMDANHDGDVTPDEVAAMEKKIENHIKKK